MSPVIVDESIPLVRLTKDKRWAVCAHVSCGERFAERIEISEELSLREVDDAGRSVRVPRKATLDFNAGWVFRDGTWVMSKRARVRQSQGHQPAFRRPPFLVTRGYYFTGFARREWDSDRKKWTTPDRDVDRPEYFKENERGLPAFVECPACGLRQVADPVALECE